MAIKLPDTAGQLVQQLAQGRSERLAAVSQLLALGLGRSAANSTEAQVQSVAPVTAEQRQQLVARLVDLLAQLEAKPDSADKQRQLARLGEERQLLNSPLLKLVRLEVKQETLITYTDQPVKPGEHLRLYLNDNRLWQLSARLQTEAARLQQTLNPAPRAQAPAPPASDSTLSAQPASASPQGRAALVEALRQALPLTDKPELSATLPQLERLSLPQQRQLLPTNVRQALEQLAQQLRSPPQLLQPQALRQTLADSGVQLEHKLAQLIGRAQALATPTAPGRERGEGESLARLMGQDWKGALLNLQQQLRGELNRLGQSPELRPQLPDTNLGQLLSQLAQRPAAELNDRTQRIQLLQLLHQQTLHSLARVQLSQLQAVGHQQAQADSPTPTQSLSVELPMRLGQEIYTLSLQIDEQWQSGYEEAKRRAGKVRQWQVLLSVELPEAGRLHAQITVREQQVATRLWAENAGTAEQIRGRLNELQQRLEKEGIEVTRLECHAGAPPKRKTQIHYSLVDITT